MLRSQNRIAARSASSKRSTPTQVPVRPFLIFRPPSLAGRI